MKSQHNHISVSEKFVNGFEMLNIPCEIFSSPQQKIEPLCKFIICSAFRPGKISQNSSSTPLENKNA